MLLKYAFFALTFTNAFMHNFKVRTREGKNTFIKAFDSKELEFNPKEFETNEKNNENFNEKSYNLNWYVIGEERKMRKNKIQKVQIWGKNYAVWSNGTKYFSIDDACSHRGASLSIGKLNNNNIVCPYHAYEFDVNGTLKVVPGLPNFENTPCQNLNTYPILAKNGWIYMNTISEKEFKLETESETQTQTQTQTQSPIFDEPESKNASFKAIFLNMEFNAYSRIVTENSLDVMHIGFVHTFGNKNDPSPTSEIPPKLVGDFPYHYKTTYEYRAGENSMVKKLFKMNDLTIENEFILPHTTIARVIFGKYVSSVITFALPLNLTHTKLFVKTYRNFWHERDNTIFSKWFNKFGDIFTTDMMSSTVMQDKAVIESILLERVNGLFNMKYDKIQNVYTSLYKKLIHNISNEKSRE